MSEPLDRLHYTCEKCHHQTPVPDDLNPDDFKKIACANCGKTREDIDRERGEAVKSGLEARRKLIKEAERDLARITEEDRERWARLCKEKGREVTPFFKSGVYIPEYGRQGWMVECSCGEYFRLFEWSFHGKGKKCPGCGFHHSVLSVLPQGENS